MFSRILKIDLPKKQSTFLWGARQTGKSSYLRAKYPDSVYYDLLETHEIVRLTKSPQLLRQEIIALNSSQLSRPIIIDEIQKVPELLNEIHWLIENSKAQFILCGSSARQLKTWSTNLLGGRAWIYHFYPLTSKEIPDFDLPRALQHGLLPKHYLSETKYLQDNLQAYVETYLTEEIRNEGLVRNLAGFSRFLDVIGFANGEMINVTKIASDAHVDRSTVQGYFQILLDTMLGYFIYPYKKKVKRDIISATPKFYFFDVGVANYLSRSNFAELRGASAGKAFEHFILMELIAFISFSRRRIEMTYWRTKLGYEVDFILGDAKVAIEVKISSQVKTQSLKGLIAFSEEHPGAKAIVVSQDARSRKIEINNHTSIRILPWKNFLKSLWDGEVI